MTGPFDDFDDVRNSDEFDQRMRHRLRAAGAGWAPRRPIEATRVELAGRVHRRRRAQTALVAAALTMIGLVAGLHHWGPSTAAGGRVEAGAPSLTVVPGRGSPAPVGPGGDTPPSGRHLGASAGGRGGGTSRVSTATSAPATTAAASSHSSSPSTPAQGAGRDVPVTPPPTSSPGTAPGPPPVTATTTTTVTPASTVPPTTGPTTVPPTVPQTSTTVTTPPVTRSQVYVFTMADSGTTVTVPLGATIDLELSGPPGTRWGRIVSSRPTVVVPLASTPVPTAGSISVTLAASSPGESTLHVPALSAASAPATLFRLIVQVQ